MNVSEELKRIQQEKHKKTARSNINPTTNTQLPQTTSKEEIEEKMETEEQMEDETKWDGEIAAQLQKQYNHIDEEEESKENDSNRHQPFISSPMHSLIRQLGQRHNNNNGISFSFSSYNSNNAPSTYHMSFSGMDSNGSAWNFQSNNENENNDDLLNFLNMRGYQDDLISSMFNRMRNVGIDTDHMSYEELLERFPIIQQGLNEDEINNNSIVDKYKKMDKKIDDKVSQECCICLEPFKKDDEIRRLPCLHIFHKKEIDQWLKTKDACPICRVSIKSD